MVTNQNPSEGIAKPTILGVAFCLLSGCVSLGNPSDLTTNPLAEHFREVHEQKGPQAVVEETKKKIVIHQYGPSVLEKCDEVDGNCFQMTHLRERATDRNRDGQLSLALAFEGKPLVFAIDNRGCGNLSSEYRQAILTRTCEKKRRTDDQANLCAYINSCYQKMRTRWSAYHAICQDLGYASAAAAKNFWLPANDDELLIKREITAPNSFPIEDLLFQQVAPKLWWDNRQPRSEKFQSQGHTLITMIDPLGRGRTFRVTRDEPGPKVLHQNNGQYKSLQISGFDESFEALNLSDVTCQKNDAGLMICPDRSQWKPVSISKDERENYFVFDRLWCTNSNPAANEIISSAENVLAEEKREAQALADFKRAKQTFESQKKPSALLDFIKEQPNSVAAQDGVVHLAKFLVQKPDGAKAVIRLYRGYMEIAKEEYHDAVRKKLEKILVEAGHPRAIPFLQRPEPPNNNS